MPISLESPKILELGKPIDVKKLCLSHYSGLDTKEFRNRESGGLEAYTDRVFEGLNEERQSPPLNTAWS